MVKATAIVQARMSSSRLPGKVMMPLCGKPVIYHILERLRLCKSLESIVLATSTRQDDNILEDAAKQIGIDCYRGSLDDVLARIYFASQGRSSHIVRVCADSPLLDSKIIDAAVGFYLDTNADIVKTINMPLGLGTEVLSYSALEQAYHNAFEVYQRDNVTPYIYENYSTYIMVFNPDYSHYRLTLDTEEDFQIIEMIYAELYTGKHDFFCREIINILERYPEIAAINSHVQQVQIQLNYANGIRQIPVPLSLWIN